MRKLFLLIIGLLVTIGISAKRIPAGNSTELTAALSSAVTGDTVIVGTGSYNSFNFPSGKSITVMALDTAKVTFTGQFGLPSTVANGTAMTMEGIKFDGKGSLSSGKYFNSATFTGTVDSIVFKNCDFEAYTRCLLNWSGCSGDKSLLKKLSIKNCILNDFESATYCMLYTGAPIQEIEMVDNTIYNSMSGAKPESLFSPKNKPTNPVNLKLTFKHNTYYSGARTDKAVYNYPLFSFQDFYQGGESTVDVSDNIFICPSTGFNFWHLFRIKAGWFSGTIKNNLFMGHDGELTPVMTVTENGDTINTASNYASFTYENNYADSTFDGRYKSIDELKISSINDVFADVTNGNFTIYTAYSPLAKLSSTGGCIGASRWINNSTNLCKLTAGIAPSSNQNAGTVTGPRGIIEKGQSVTLKAVKNFGYKFIKWIDGNGAVLNDTSSTYTFKLDKDMAVYAVFDSVAIYKLSVNVIGGGEYSVSPAGKDGGYQYYEDGTDLTFTAKESPIFSFLAWYDNYSTMEGYSATNPLTVKMTKNITKYVEFAKEPYICGWQFAEAGKNGNSLSAKYVGDYVDATAVPAMAMYYTYTDKTTGHTPFGTWWAAKDGENSVTSWHYYTADGSKTNDTIPTRLKGEAYYLETLLNTTGYKDFRITYGLKTSYYGYDTYLLQIKYKEESAWETVASHNVTSSYTTFIDTVANTGGKEKLYLRIIPDVTSSIHGDIKDVDGTGYKDIYILAEWDGVKPVGFKDITVDKPLVFVDNGYVNIKVHGTQKVTILSLDGRIVKEMIVNGLTSFPLNQKGLYFMKAGDNVTKFIY